MAIRHPMICAHCGDPIPESPYHHTWVSAMEQPGQPFHLMKRYHISRDRPECRRASGAFGTDPEENQ